MLLGMVKREKKTTSEKKKSKANRQTGSHQVTPHRTKTSGENLTKLG